MEPTSNITGGAVDPVFTARVLGKHDISYYRCRDTGYLQTEAPYWLEEAYASPMNITDTGILLRNTRFQETAGAALHGIFPDDAKFLDYAGGYGVYTRMMRDAGFDYYWDDPYTRNVMARGFEYSPALKPIAALTAFEVFEHLPSPRVELEKMLGLSKNIFFSTQLLPEPYPQPSEWWYYALEHGQHISFYTLKSLESLAHQNQRLFVSNRSDLHGFIDPGQLPSRVMARWFWEWLGYQDKSTVEIVHAAYVFAPQSRQASHWKQRLKNLHLRWRFPGVFVLKPGLAASAMAALRTTSLTRDYAEHLLCAGSIYWPDISTRLKSRTLDDMHLLKKRLLHAQQTEVRA